MTPIDKRLSAVQQTVFEITGIKVLTAIVQKGLLTEEGEPTQSMNEAGRDVLITAVKTAVSTAFQNSTVNAPAGFSLEEVQLVDSIVKGQGEPRVTIVGNVVGVRFNGQSKLFSSLVTPRIILEGDIVDNRINGVARKMTINGRGLLDDSILRAKNDKTQ